MTQYSKQQLLSKYRYSANNSILYKLFCKLKQKKQAIGVRILFENDKVIPLIFNTGNLRQIQIGCTLWNTLYFV